MDFKKISYVPTFTEMLTDCQMDTDMQTDTPLDEDARTQIRRNFKE